MLWAWPSIDFLSKLCGLNRKYSPYRFVVDENNGLLAVGWRPHVGPARFGCHLIPGYTDKRSEIEGADHRALSLERDVVGRRDRPFDAGCPLFSENAR
jgi:hypothetical protein